MAAAGKGLEMVEAMGAQKPLDVGMGGVDLVFGVRGLGHQAVASWIG